MPRPPASDNATIIISSGSCRASERTGDSKEREETPRDSLLRFLEEHYPKSMESYHLKPNLECLPPQSPSVCGPDPNIVNHERIGWGASGDVHRVSNQPVRVADS